MRLPDADGIGLLEHIKQIAPETEVVLMTAHGSLDVTIEASAHVVAIDVAESQFATATY